MKAGVKEERQPVLDPVSRISEIVFGVLMALSFTGALNVATAGREEVRTVMLTALGCNLAWGIVDAVMYLIATLTVRGRNLTLLHQVRSAVDAQTAQAVITQALPNRLLDAIGPDGLEAMRRRLVALSDFPSRTTLHREDFVGAIGVFLLVVLSTLPVVVPFIVLSRLNLAMRVSNGIALLMLAMGGYQLGRYAGGNPLRTGLGMAALGAVLVSIIMALGG
jgi:VIT1/CCC1 family predicted Fe2+/Mn2+ transporter